MLKSEFQGGLELGPGDRVELIVTDASLARAMFEGIPAARLLGRARLASDERDASTSSPGSFASSWDTLLTRLLEHSVVAKERVKRAIARHTRVAVDEGPLNASEAIIATLVHAVASSEDADASLSEIFPQNEPRGRGAAWDPIVAAMCAVFDTRLASTTGDARGPMLEACVRLAARACVGPLPWERLRDAATKLSGPELALTMLRAAKGSLFPPRLEAEPADAHAAKATRTERRMVQLERAELDALVARDPRVLASAIARLETGAAPSSSQSGRGASQLDSLVADLGRLLAHEGALVLAIPSFEPSIDEAIPESSVSNPSWHPHDWSSPDAAPLLADALERGGTTAARVRAVVLGGGEPALDALGAEMLLVTAHPFASAAFAEILARSGRPRDVMRLVTYFAVAPDPAQAARALSVCAAPELPRVLSAWLEAMLPSDGEMALAGDDPETSSAARLTACVASLAPYPHLHGAVKPLLSRVSEAPPPASA
jgi:hypothetical protein